MMRAGSGAGAGSSVGRIALIAALAGAAAAPAQSPSTTSPPAPLVLTLDQALDYAVEHYPSIRAALEQVNASTAAVAVARSSYLPRLDSTWQSSLATTNNVFGQVLPQSVIPGLTGPVLAAESGVGVYGSAAGALLSWQPLDFGLRRTAVTGAEAEVERARASETLTRLEVQAGVGAAFLDALAAERSIAAASADLERRDLLARAVRALVDNDLRPGAEASRADAERAAAQTRLIQAQAASAVARTLLVRTLGTAGVEVTIDAGDLMERVPETAAAPAKDAAEHPLALAREASIDAALARETAVARTDLPRIYLQSSVFARGSGAGADGDLDTSTDGLGFDRDNWAVGIQILFPDLFAFSSLRSRKAEAAASRGEAAARYDEALLEIESRRDAAAAMTAAARAVAASTPLQLEAARQSEAQARARHQAGLTNLVEVADAQSLLAQAELVDQLARVDVWRALLAEALARGDLASFLAAVRAPAPSP